MGLACRTYGEKRFAYSVFAEKCEGKRPLGRSRLKWEDNIKIYLLDVG
jgi:hypothetical protein